MPEQFAVLAVIAVDVQLVVEPAGGGGQEDALAPDEPVS